MFCRAVVAMMCDCVVVLFRRFVASFAFLVCCFVGMLFCKVVVVCLFCVVEVLVCCFAGLLRCRCVVTPLLLCYVRVVVVLFVCVCL